MLRDILLYTSPQLHVQLSANVLYESETKVIRVEHEVNGIQIIKLSDFSEL